MERKSTPLGSVHRPEKRCDDREKHHVKPPKQIKGVKPRIGRVSTHDDAQSYNTPNPQVNFTAIAFRQEFHVFSGKRKSGRTPPHLCYNTPSMRTIAIHLRLETASHRKRMMGIFRFLGATDLWDVRIIPNEDALYERLTAKNPAEIPDGIISGMPHSEKVLSAIRSSGIPFVGIGMPEAAPLGRQGAIGFVQNDNEGIGRAAANHFMSLGDFRSCAFIPDTKDREWSRLRGQAFADALSRAGKPCRIFVPGDSADDESALSDFIAGLPKPAAVFAAWDGRAVDVIHTAHRMKLAIPSELAVLGVDDDEMICEHTVPTLSSVRTDAEGMGEAAARMLLGLLNGRKNRRPSRVRCPVLGITERNSTQPPAPATSLVNRALEFIAAEACNGIRPDDVAKHLKVSRRLLDLRFSQCEDKSVAERITDRKLERIRELLATSQRPVKDIFRRAGFDNVAYATRLFGSAVGVTPEAWRNLHAQRGKAPAASPSVERLTDLSEADARRLAELVRQLTPDARFDADRLRPAIRHGETLVFAIRSRGRIIASATAVRFPTPTDEHWRLEDVVVDGKHCGKGLGRRLMDGVLLSLRRMNVRKIELTSRPSRVAANALYRSLGFTRRTTNVYELPLP